MKKLFQTFLIKSKDKDYNLYSDATGNRYHSSNKSSSILSGEKYKSYQFDEVEIDGCSGDSIFGERCCSHAEEQKFENRREEPEISSDCATKLLDSEVSSVNEVKIIKSDFSSNQNLINSSNVLNNLNDSNRICNLIEEFQSNNNKLVEEKRKCNSYFISIENSRNFHIGHRTTINSPGSLINSKAEKEIDQLQMEQLLCSQDRLTEDIMKIIAFNFEGYWKNFAHYFDLDEESLEELEERFESSTFIIYEILQRFNEEHPNPSLGFVARVLRDNNQFNILEKLLRIK